jgi:hypothetical protein
MAVRKYLDVSLSLISEKDIDLLRQEAAERRLLAVEICHHGYWIEPVLPRGVIRWDLQTAGYSDTLLRILERARTVNADWIKLDVNGDPDEFTDVIPAV